MINPTSGAICWFILITGICCSSTATIQSCISYCISWCVDDSLIFLTYLFRNLPHWLWLCKPSFVKFSGTSTTLGYIPHPWGFLSFVLTAGISCSSTASIQSCASFASYGASVRVLLFTGSKGNRIFLQFESNCLNSSFIYGYVFANIGFSNPRFAVPVF